FAAMDELTQEEYLARFMFELDEKSRLRTAENKGLTQGRAEGRTEGHRDVARRMLEKGLDPEAIAELTALSLDEIRAL
ncbi:MAG: hypothetical protein IJ654_07860, partial [Bacteroidales bacterium]|nr:hypothetical protein [Bacteroidales bacterium]